MQRIIPTLRLALGLPGLAALFFCAAASAQQSANLAAVFNVYAIAHPGSPVTGGGIDGYGDAYAADQVSTSVTWSGEVFNFGTPGPTSGVTNKTIPLPVGKFTTLSFLGAAIGGAQKNQIFIVTYTDGTKTSFAQNLSDWNVPQHYRGESIAVTTAYRIRADGSEQAGTFNVYGYALTVDGSKTVSSVTLPNNVHVLVLAIDMSASGTMPTPTGVSLTSVDNLYGIANPGSTVSGGGTDGSGDAYAANVLGGFLLWSGQTFTFAAPGPDSAIARKTIPLPASKALTLSFLATGVDGNQPNQTFIVTYTDGSHTTFTQSLSDWHTPQSYAGESVALSTPYKIGPSGGESKGLYDLYGYTIALDGSKTVQSFTLPNNPHVIVLSVDLSASQVAGTPAFSNPTGTYTGSVSVALSDSTGSAQIHYTLDNSAPTSASPLYSTPLQITATTTVKAIATAVGYMNSAVASAAYTVIYLPAATPTFSAAAGYYQSPLAVTVTDSTPAAMIYYTADGSVPGTGSSPLTGPITLTTSTTPQQIQAIATAPGYLPSAVASAAYLLPPFPSDGLPGSDIFLFNAAPANSAMDAMIAVSCQYYMAVGAVTSCDTNADGSFVTGITMSEWMTSRYNPYGYPESAAIFANIEDLNFTRDHHAIEYLIPGAPYLSSAAYVCNYDGPDFYHSGDATTVNAAIANAQTQIANRKKGIFDPKENKPCVAFDYGVNANSAGQSVNSGKPFVRFLVFNPQGELLPTVDLDGRGQKSVPNACSACHGVPIGGTLPAGGFQTLFGASYIPFDENNMVFSTATGKQEPALKALNEIVLNYADQQSYTAPDARIGINQLIHGWYDTSSGPLTSPTQQVGYAPPDFYLTPFDLTPKGLAAGDELIVYQAIYAPMCRSCHIANNVGHNFNPNTQVTTQIYPFPPTRGFSSTGIGPTTAEPDLLSLFDSAGVCAPSQPIMPNSKAAFDRFWSTHTAPGAPTSLTDLPAVLLRYFGDAKNILGFQASCTLDLPVQALPPPTGSATHQVSR